jgi:catechol 2,3-dioxygenase-like lactoylglutathione lyase family enzyme
MLGAIGTAVYRSRVDDAVPAAVPTEAAESARDTLGGALAASEQLAGPLAADLTDAAREAFTRGLQLAATLSALVVIGAAILALALLRQAQSDAEPGEQPDVEPDAPIVGGRSALGECHKGSRMLLKAAEVDVGETAPSVTERNAMSLMNYCVNASVAVSDMARARRFYESKLGLAEGVDQADGSRIYSCRDGTALHVYPSPTSAGNTSGTIATWYVDDLDRVVDELTAAGVTFERYDEPELQTDATGIHLLDDGGVAWFKDPDGNTFAIEQ